MPRPHPRCRDAVLGMPWWQWLVDVAGLCLLLLLLYAAALLVRRRLLTRSGGTFEVSLRARADRPGRGWVLGVGRYAGDDFEVFRLFSLRMRPLRSLPRSGLEVVGQRDAVRHVSTRPWPAARRDPSSTG